MDVEAELEHRVVDSRVSNVTRGERQDRSHAALEPPSSPRPRAGPRHYLLLIVPCVEQPELTYPDCASILGLRHEIQQQMFKIFRSSHTLLEIRRCAPGPKDITGALHHCMGSCICMNLGCAQSSGDG